MVADIIMEGIMDDCRKQEKLFLTPTIICTYTSANVHYLMQKYK